MSDTTSGAAATVALPAPVIATGTVAHLHSDSAGCICCPGRHVFAYKVIADPDTPDEHRHRNIDTAARTDGLDYAEVVHRFVRALPEGTRIRITVEAADTDAPPAAPRTLHLVTADDWRAVYVDGVCVHQGHDIPERVWVSLAAAGPYETDTTHDDSPGAYKVAEELGRFPDSYDEFLTHVAA